MNGTVDEVIRVAEAEGIDADIRRTDELMVATKPAQLDADAGRGRAPAALGRRRDRVFEIVCRDEAKRASRIPGALGGDAS